MVLVHPVSNGTNQPFPPCTYGYAFTIRRAQGASLKMGCLYFDHCYPPDRGYGYVGVSRFRSAEGVFHYGKLRRTDWLPVGGDPAMEQVHRSVESMDSGSDDEHDRELDRLYEEDDGPEDDLDEDYLHACRHGQAEEDDRDDVYAES